MAYPGTNVHTFGKGDTIILFCKKPSSIKPKKAYSKPCQAINFAKYLIMGVEQGLKSSADASKNV